MDEHAEDPVGQAGQKVVQYASLATMAAEAIAQVRQQRAAAAAASDAQTAAAVRAQRTAALTAAQSQWQPVLDGRLHSRTSLGDAGLAWAAAQGWREFDPQAALASDRAEQRLRELRPDVMERFDRLTSTGLDPVEAMRRVAPFFDRPAARPGEHTVRASLGTASSPDTLVDDARAGALPEPPLGQQQPQSTTATPAVTLNGAAVGSTRTAAELAKDGFPEPLTGEVLTAGRVRPKAPTSTAPAAVRASGLATAARAATHAR